MYLRVLGPIELGVPGPATIAPKPRTMLALLLVRANTVVPVDLIMDEVWGDNPPPSARDNVRLYARVLRRLLDGAPGEPDLTRRGKAYQLAVQPAVLDIHAFHHLIGEAGQAMVTGDAAAASGLLDRALGLWRGPALLDVPVGRVLAGWQVTVEQERLHALEQHARVLLDLGAVDRAAGRARELIATEPLRERGHELLARARYQAGDIAGALAVLDAARQILDEELGVPPGEPLRELQLAILNREPPSSAARADQPAVIAVPRQLPPDAVGFTGRTAEMRALDAALEPSRERGTEAVMISAIAGTAGVGKTALAVHWAHGVADRFPDGQLYVNLRGYDPDLPLAPADVLMRFMPALGVSIRNLPSEIDDLAARYRTAVAGRRLLIVLDNASSVEQVRPLLPGTGSCTVVVTSRDALVGLVARDGARRVDLDLLPAADAHALLGRLVDKRVRAEPAAAAALVEMSVRLPLALRLVAELAVSRPATPLTALAAELADLQHRLTQLDPIGDPHTAVTAVFSWSVRQLPAPVLRMFTLLGVHPGSDFDSYAAAALADIGLRDATRALDQLARAYLIRRLDADRFSMHDLLRAYAAGLVADVDIAPALRRLFDYYLATAAAGMDHMYPAHAQRRPPVTAVGTPTPVLADQDAARMWLDTERHGLIASAVIAATRGWPTHAIHLSAILTPWLHAGHYADAVTVHTHARQAAGQVGDVAGAAQATAALGAVESTLARFEPAAEHLHSALDGFRQAGDDVGVARTLGELGNIDLWLGRYQPALARHRRALALLRRIGDRSGEATAVSNVGTALSRLEQFDQAATQYRRAVGLFREAGNAAGEALALNNLGGIEQRLGRYGAAEGHLRRALDLHRRLGNRSGEAFALLNLGAVAQRLARYDVAEAHLRHALDLHRQAGFPYGQAVTLDRLGRVLSRAGRHEQAAACGLAALDLFRTVSDLTHQAMALNGLGEIAHAAGRQTDALAHHAEALSIGRGARTQRARANAGLGRAHRTLNHGRTARQHFERALALYADLGLPDAETVRRELTLLVYERI